MKRWSIVLLSIIMAYGLLRFWPSDVSRVYAAMAASLLVLFGWYGAVGNRRLRSAPIIQHVLMGTVALSCGSLLTLFFLHAPAALDEASEQLVEWIATPQQRQTQQVQQQIGKHKTQAGNWLWNEQTIRPLPRRANLKPGNQPEVFLQLEDPAEAPKLIARRAYVSAFALGSYGDASWTLTSSDTTNPPAFPQRPGPLLRYEIFHPSDPSGQTPLVALQGLRDAKIAPLSYRGDGVSILPPSEGIIGYRYRARSQPLALEDLDDNAQAAARTVVPSAWLALPDEQNLVSSIRGLNAESVTSGSLKKQLLQVRTAIQQECQYSLDIANPDNRDPLENFLLYEKSGHCELFATAGAMAARALGVPARIAYGWTGGSYYENSNLFVFRAREAHAWTEVLIADVGWVVMDCTPASSIGQSRAAPPGEKPVTDDEQVAEHDHGMIDETNLSFISMVLGITGFIGIGLSFVCLGWARKQGASSPSPYRTGAPLMGYYQTFLRYCSQQKVPVKPHQTLRQLLRTCSPLPHFALRLQRYHYAIRYGNDKPDADTEKSLQQEIHNELT